MSEIKKQYIKFLLGTASPTSNELKLTHLAFFTKDVSYSNFEADTLASDGSEFDRVAITFTQDIANPSLLKAKASLLTTTANCATTTISTKTSSNEFILTSATNFKLYDSIEVQLNDNTYKPCKIIYKSGSTIKTDLNLDTSVGKTVRLNISKVALICDGTSTLGTGQIYKWFSYRKFKNSGQSFPLYLEDIIKI